MVAHWVWVRVEVCWASQTLCCNNIAAHSLVSFSALKEPAKELKLSFMSGEKYMSNIYQLWGVDFFWNNPIPFLARCYYTVMFVV